MITLLVSEMMPREAIAKLMGYGYEVITLPSFSALPDPIASHPDSLIAKLSDRIFTCADYCDRASYVFTDLLERHPWLKLSFLEDRVGKRYPEDARYNLLFTGEEVILNPRSIAGGILEYTDQAGVQRIEVKQGYPACSTLYLDGLAITADPSIEKALLSRGREVLKIGSGYISLPPYEYGFIGGASAVIGRRVFFFGNPETHPDGGAILGEIKARGYDAVALLSGGLLDLGGITVIDDDAYYNGNNRQRDNTAYAEEGVACVDQYKSQ